MVRGRMGGLCLPALSQRLPASFPGATGKFFSGTGKLVKVRFALPPHRSRKRKDILQFHNDVE